MTLFVFKCHKEVQEQLTSNFYKNKEDYHCMQANMSLTKLKKITQEIEHTSKAQQLVKLGNPFKILFDTEQDLLICLGVQDPEVTASL